MNEEKTFTIPVSEYNLLRLLEKQSEISEEDFWKYIYYRYDEFVEDVSGIFKICFPHVKDMNKYSNEFLAEQIFKIEVEEKDLKSLHKYSLMAILRELEWLKKELASYEHDKYYSDYFKGKIRYLWNIIFNIQEFVEVIQTYNKDINCRHHFSRRQIHSMEVMDLARRMPRYEYYFDDIAQGPVSIFLIRQGIELRIIEILGILDVKKKTDNSLAKVTPDRFLRILKNSEIKLPMPYNLIARIHSWTNLYVHRAKIYDYWKVEWAIKTIRSFIFEKTKVQKSYKSQLKNDIYNALEDGNREKYNINFGNFLVEWCEDFVE